MVNFNGRIGNIDVPFSRYDTDTSQRNQTNADDSIFNFDSSEINSLRVQNSKQDMNPDEFAQQYAKENGLLSKSGLQQEIDEIKRQERIENGTASRQDMMSPEQRQKFFGIKETSKPLLNTEKVQQLAEEQNLSFEGTKTKLKDVYGEPEKPEPNIFAKHFANQNNISEDEAQFVLEKIYGMTDNIFRF